MILNSGADCFNYCLRTAIYCHQEGQLLASQGQQKKYRRCLFKNYFLNLFILSTCDLTTCKVEWSDAKTELRPCAS